MTDSKILPTAATAAAAAAGLGVILYMMKKQRTKRPYVKANSVRKPSGLASHIYIQTLDVQASSRFFEAFGLARLSNNETYTVLSCPNKSQSKHEPYIILEQVEHLKIFDTATVDASNVGIGRICMGVKDVYETVEVLQAEFNLTPIAPPVCDRPGSPDEHGVNNGEAEVVIVAYRDPSSGLMLELVSMKMTPLLNVMVGMAQLTTSLEFPLFVHANVNVSNYGVSMAAYEALGFSKIAKHYGRVVNSLYKALKIPNPGIAKQVTLVKTPGDGMFCLDLIEWEDPSPKKSINVGSNVRIGITVQDLPNHLDQLLIQGSSSTDNNTTEKYYWKLVDTPKLLVEFPLGRTLVATVEDVDGLQMDLVEYPMEVSGMDIVSNNSTTSDKVLLITGCDSGFGRSLACRMSALGFTVVAACYSQSGAHYLSNIVARTIVADLGDKDSVDAIVAAVRDTLQEAAPERRRRQLYGIVNNAAVCYPGNVEWLQPHLYKQAMQINFHAPVSIIHELLGDLKQCRSSRLLQVSSVCGMLSQPTNSAYCSTKHALEAYSDVLRCELMPYDVKVCIVQPATMKTPLGLGYWDSWYKGYKSAPPAKTRSIQNDKVPAFVAKNKDMLHNAAEDPNVTVTAMVQALLEPNPPTRLTTGGAANWFFRPASQLPDRMRDQLLWNIVGLGQAHAVV